MLTNRFVQSCTIVKKQYNEYSDPIYSSGVTEYCRLRKISKTDRVSHGVEDSFDDSDAVLWLKPNTSAKVGDVVIYESETYEIDKFNEARKLGSNTIEFIKCGLKVITIAFS
jgi:hypothetical protein